MYPKVDAIVFSLDFDSGNLAYVEQENVLFYLSTSDPNISTVQI